MRGAAVAASEAGIKQRVVISVFDSVAKAIAAHDGPAYQAAVKVPTAPNATCGLSKGWNRVSVNYTRHLLHRTESRSKATIRVNSGPGTHAVRLQDAESGPRSLG